METTAPTTNTLIITKEGRTIRVIDCNKERPNLKVFFSGPFTEEPITTDQNGHPFWTVTVAFEEDQPKPRYSYRISTFEKANNLATKISQDQGLELLTQAHDLD